MSLQIKLEKFSTSTTNEEDFYPSDDSEFGGNGGQSLFCDLAPLSSSSSSPSSTSPEELLHVGILPMLSAHDVDVGRSGGNSVSLFANSGAEDELALDFGESADVVFSNHHHQQQPVMLRSTTNVAHTTTTTTGGGGGAVSPSMLLPPPPPPPPPMSLLTAPTTTTTTSLVRSDDDDEFDEDRFDEDEQYNVPISSSSFLIMNNNNNNNNNNGGSNTTIADSASNIQPQNFEPVVVQKKKVGRPKKVRDAVPTTGEVVQREKRAKVSSIATRSANNPQPTSSSTSTFAPPLQASLEASGYHPKRLRTTHSDDDVEELTAADQEANRVSTISAIASLPVATAYTDAALPRDSLLLMTSDALDEWQARLSAVRTLTNDDRRELQRQRRLVKNRESAQLSRQRKKGYIGQLELRLTELSNSHDQLQATNDSLKSENQALRDELNAIRQIADGDARFAKMISHIRPSSSSTSSSSGSTTPPPLTQSSGRQQQQRTALRAAAATLMVMLFSFGALFHGASLSAQAPLRSNIDSSSSSSSMLGSSLIPLNNAPIVELQAPRHHATGRMLLAKRNDSNATPHWIDEQAMSHDDDDASHRAKHFEAASRFERPASLAQLLEVLPCFDDNNHNNNNNRQPSSSSATASARRLTGDASSVPSPSTANPRRVIVTDEPIDAAAASSSMTAWSARRSSSGPVPNATYWYTPRVRALRRGVDPHLLGLMLPLTAFDGDMPLGSQQQRQHARDAASGSSVVGDDVPVLEVMCEVKSVLRTPFFASTFDDSVVAPQS